MASGFLQQRESARSARSEEARSSTLLYTILRITLPDPSPGTLGPGARDYCHPCVDVRRYPRSVTLCHLKNIEHTLSTPAAPAAPRASPGKISKGESPGLPKPGRRRHWLSRRRGREFSGRGPSGGGGCAEARDVEREVTHCLWRQVDLEAHRAHLRLHRPRHRALGLAGVAWAARGRRGRWREADGACCREGFGCERVREVCGAWWRVAACGVRVWGGGDGGGGGATLRAGPLCYLSAASPLPLLLPLRYL